MSDVGRQGKDFFGFIVENIFTSKLNLKQLFLFQKFGLKC